MICGDVRSAEAAARSGRFGAALLDLNLPDGDGLTLLGKIRKQSPDLACFILSVRDKAADAVAALKIGALDYFTKPFEPATLFASIQSAMRRNSRPTHPASVAAQAPSTMWRSTAMREVHQLAQKAARSDVSVLLTGETGCGKGVLANLIHRGSARATRPFITISCPTIPAELLESELFGHERGAFTGAQARKRGKIEMVDGGTLFLDEIGDLPLMLQPKLLEVLQTRNFYRVGSEQPLGSDFRLICATNIDFAQAVRNGTFREDLYYRINVLPIRVPPLRERGEDIPLLCDLILAEICVRDKIRRPMITKQAMEVLLDYHWPGNVRHLRHVIERACAIGENGIIGCDELPEELTKRQAEPSASALTLGFASKDELLRANLIAALDACGGNRRRAAKRLDVSLRTVYNLIDRFGLRSKKVVGAGQTDKLPTDRQETV